MWLHFSMSIILPLTTRKMPWNSRFRLACSDLKNGRMSIKYVAGSILLRQGRGIIDICQYPHYNDSQHRTAHAEVAEMAGPCKKLRICACPDFVDSGRSERTEADCPLIMTVDEYECLHLMVLRGSRSLWRIFHAAAMDMEKDIAAENTVQIR